MASINGIVITVSDRALSGEREDKSGPLAVELLAGYGVECPPPMVVPDEIPLIQDALRAALAGGARVIVTTGGTGIMPRDVTPEAVAPLIHTELPGIAEQIRAAGLASTPLAGLTRTAVGVTSRDESGAFVVCAPGSPGGVRDTIGVVGPLIEHIIDQLASGDH